MKKTIFFVLTFIGILIIACNNSMKDVEENPYKGAWKITYTKYITPDTTIERTQFFNPAIKSLTEKHYAFGRQSGRNKVWGGGGEYSYKGDTYTEYIKYHSHSTFVGHSVRYRSSIKDDLWTISTDTLNIKSVETWKRIE